MRAKDVLARLESRWRPGPASPAGLRILNRNWRSAREIDIVAVERHVLVVCEVKSRTSTRYGSPLEAVSRPNGQAAQAYGQWLKTHGIRSIRSASM